MYVFINKKGTSALKWVHLERPVLVAMLVECGPVHALLQFYTFH